MIGGTMLLCAVGAMVLLATWSLARDDDPDTRPRDGLLALRDWTARRLSAQEKRDKARSDNRRTPTKKRRAKHRSQTRAEPRDAEPASAKTVALRFDSDEMAEIAEEIEKAPPAIPEQPERLKCGF